MLNIEDFENIIIPAIQEYYPRLSKVISHNHLNDMEFWSSGFSLSWISGRVPKIHITVAGEITGRVYDSFIIHYSSKKTALTYYIDDTLRQLNEKYEPEKPSPPATVLRGAATEVDLYIIRK